MGRKGRVEPQLSEERLRLALKLHAELAHVADLYLEEVGQLLLDVQYAAERLNQQRGRPLRLPGRVVTISGI